MAAGCSTGDLSSDMAGLRTEIEQLQRDIPPEAPLWISEGENAFPKFLDDHSPRVPDFVYNHIVTKLVKGSAASFDSQAAGDFAYDACMGDPSAFRGKFWRVRMTIGVLRAQQVNPETGATDVHTGLGWINRLPVVFHCVEKPEVLRLHDDIIEFTGLFLKIHRFTAKDGSVVDAPLFLAKVVRKYY